MREKLGAVLHTSGCYDAALEVLEQAGETYRATGDLERLGAVSGQIGRVHADRGTAAEGVERLQPLLVALEEWGAWHGVAALYLALTDLLWHIGRYPEQLAAAWAHLEVGEVAQAAEMVAQAITRERAAHHRLALVEALWVQAMVLTRQERWTEAEHVLEEGLSLARSMPYPYAEARLLHVYGQMHAQKGEPGPARDRLERALAIFQRLGARVDAARVEQAIADLPRL